MYFHHFLLLSNGPFQHGTEAFISLSSKPLDFILKTLTLPPKAQPTAASISYYWRDFSVLKQQSHTAADLQPVVE